MCVSIVWSSRLSSRSSVGCCTTIRAGGAPDEAWAAGCGAADEGGTGATVEATAVAGDGTSTLVAVSVVTRATVGWGAIDAAGAGAGWLGTAVEASAVAGASNGDARGPGL